MKLMVVLGTFLFACGASLIIYDWVLDIRHRAAELPWELTLVAMLLMAIPIIALIGWVIWKAIGKL